MIIQRFRIAASPQFTQARTHIDSAAIYNLPASSSYFKRSNGVSYFIHQGCREVGEYRECNPIIAYISPQQANPPNTMQGSHVEAAIHS
jgi:hypothetical protein